MKTKNKGRKAAALLDRLDVRKLRRPRARMVVNRRDAKASR